MMHIVTEKIFYVNYIRLFKLKIIGIADKEYLQKKEKQTNF